MKNYFNCTLLFLFSFSITGFAQINFEKGYFIDNQGGQINCLIKNIDWRYNPVEFKYKLTEDSEVKTSTIKNVSEFVIIGLSKYVRTNVGIDRSSEDLNDLSLNKAPVFKEEELFLKVLVEGDKNLYQYTENRFSRYFYNSDFSKIVQLVYKTYEVKGSSGGVYYKYNEMFKQQLYNDVNCEQKSIKTFVNVSYQQKDLIKTFVSHNSCKGDDMKKTYNSIKKDWFNLRLRPGVNFSSYSMNGGGYNGVVDVKFENQVNYRIGIEAEFVLPFNNNKWSVILEPTYQYFKSETRTKYYNTDQEVKMDYKSIEFPVGIRYRMFFNEKHTGYINAFYVSDFSGSSEIQFEKSRNLELITGSNLAFGLGYEFMDKFSIEFRIYDTRPLLGNVNLKSNYNTSSIIFGYKLF